MRLVLFVVASLAAVAPVPCPEDTPLETVPAEELLCEDIEPMDLELQLALDWQPVSDIEFAFEPTFPAPADECEPAQVPARLAPRAWQPPTA
jgi:hypothetical protein